MTIASTEKRTVLRPATRGYGETEAFPASFRNDASPERDPATLRRWRIRLAENVNLLHPKAKTVFAMRVLDGPRGFRNKWAGRLGRHFGLRLPSALILGLEPETTAVCQACLSRGGCPREGIGYRQLARTVAEGSDLGTRLYMTAGGGADRYWPELLDLSLRHPECTFLLFAGPDLIVEAAEGRTALSRIGEEAAAAGNVGFVLPAAGRGSTNASSRMGVAALLREAGAPFGFVSGVSAETASTVGSDAWIEGMLEQGCLFGFFYPGDGAWDQDVVHSIRRLQEGAPFWTLSLERDVLFSGEADPRSSSRARHKDRRPALIVHPVTPRIRWMTLLESIEVVPFGLPHGDTPLVCPLELDRGDARGALYAILGQSAEAAGVSRSLEATGAQSTG